MKYGSTASAERRQSSYNVAVVSRLVVENLRRNGGRTLLSVLASGAEVAMILALVGITTW